MSKKRVHNSDVVESVKKPKPWALGLKESMNDPELQVLEDELVVVIKDKYPKAKFHYLVIPKVEIGSLKKLTSEHVQLVKHMYKIGKTLTHTDEHEKHKFKFGFHAEPSMHMLHLHIISDDLNSPCLKTKKHWNSFTSDFFINPKVVIDNLKENNKVKLPTSDEIKKFMNKPLKCHICDFKPKHLPALKIHFLTHFE